MIYHIPAPCLTHQPHRTHLIISQENTEKSLVFQLKKYKAHDNYNVM